MRKKNEAWSARVLFTIALLMLFISKAFAQGSTCAFLSGDPTAILLTENEETGSVEAFLYNESDPARAGIPNSNIFVTYDTVDVNGNAEHHLCKIVTESSGAAKGYATFNYDPNREGCYGYDFTYCPIITPPGYPLGAPSEQLGLCLGKEEAVTYDSIDFCDEGASFTPSGISPAPPQPAGFAASANSLDICNPNTTDAYGAVCWPLTLILGFLLGAMFLMGKNPLTMFDMGAPRPSRGKQYQMRQGGASYSLAAAAGAFEKATGDIKTRAKGVRDEKGNLVPQGGLLSSGFGKLGQWTGAGTRALGKVTGIGKVIGKAKEGLKKMSEKADAAGTSKGKVITSATDAPKVVSINGKKVTLQPGQSVVQSGGQFKVVGGGGNVLRAIGRVPLAIGQAAFATAFGINLAGTASKGAGKGEKVIAAATDKDRKISISGKHVVLKAGESVVQVGGKFEIRKPADVKAGGVNPPQSAAPGVKADGTPKPTFFAKIGNAFVGAGGMGNIFSIFRAPPSAEQIARSAELRPNLATFITQLRSSVMSMMLSNIIVGLGSFTAGFSQGVMALRGAEMGQGKTIAETKVGFKQVKQGEDIKLENGTTVKADKDMLIAVNSNGTAILGADGNVRTFQTATDKDGRQIGHIEVNAAGQPIGAVISGEGSRMRVEKGMEYEATNGQKVKMKEGGIVATDGLGRVIVDEKGAVPQVFRSYSHFDSFMQRFSVQSAAIDAGKQVQIAKDEVGKMAATASKALVENITDAKLLKQAEAIRLGPGTEEDKLKAILVIAANAGVEGAQETMNKLNSVPRFGPSDTKKIAQATILYELLVGNGTESKGILAQGDKRSELLGRQDEFRTHGNLAATYQAAASWYGTNMANSFKQDVLDSANSGLKNAEKRVQEEEKRLDDYKKRGVTGEDLAKQEKAVADAKQDVKGAQKLIVDLKEFYQGAVRADAKESLLREGFVSILYGKSIEQVSNELDGRKAVLAPAQAALDETQDKMQVQNGQVLDATNGQKITIEKDGYVKVDASGKVVVNDEGKIPQIFADGKSGLAILNNSQFNTLKKVEVGGTPTRNNDVTVNDIKAPAPGAGGTVLYDGASQVQVVEKKDNILLCRDAATGKLAIYRADNIAGANAVNLTNISVGVESGLSTINSQKAQLDNAKNKVSSAEDQRKVINGIESDSKRLGPSYLGKAVAASALGDNLNNIAMLKKEGIDVTNKAALEKQREQAQKELEHAKKDLAAASPGTDAAGEAMAAAAKAEKRMENVSQGININEMLTAAQDAKVTDPIGAMRTTAFALSTVAYLESTERIDRKPSLMANSNVTDAFGRYNAGFVEKQFQGDVSVLAETDKFARQAREDYSAVRKAVNIYNAGGRQDITQDLYSQTSNMIWGDMQVNAETKKVVGAELLVTKLEKTDLSKDIVSGKPLGSSDVAEPGKVPVITAVSPREAEKGGGVYVITSDGQKYVARQEGDAVVLSKEVKISAKTTSISGEGITLIVTDKDGATQLLKAETMRAGIVTTAEAGAAPETLPTSSYFERTVGGLALVKGTMEDLMDKDGNANKAFIAQYGEYKAVMDALEKVTNNKVSTADGTVSAWEQMNTSTQVREALKQQSELEAKTWEYAEKFLHDKVSAIRGTESEHVIIQKDFYKYPPFQTAGGKNEADEVLAATNDSMGKFLNNAGYEADSRYTKLFDENGNVRSGVDLKDNADFKSLVSDVETKYNSKIKIEIVAGASRDDEIVGAKADTKAYVDGNMVLATNRAKQTAEGLLNEYGNVVEITQKAQIWEGDNRGVSVKISIDTPPQEEVTSRWASATVAAGNETVAATTNAQALIGRERMLFDSDMANPADTMMKQSAAMLANSDALLHGLSGSIYSTSRDDYDAYGSLRAAGDKGTTGSASIDGAFSSTGAFDAMNTATRNLEHASDHLVAGKGFRESADGVVKYGTDYAPGGLNPESILDNVPTMRSEANRNIECASSILEMNAGFVGTPLPEGMQHFARKGAQ